MRLFPGEDILAAVKLLKHGETIEFTGGRYVIPRTLFISGKRGIRVVMRGIASLSSQNGYGMKFERCSDISLENVHVEDCYMAGIQMVECKGISLENVECHDNRGSGFLTGNCDDVTIKHSTFLRNEHGIYLSQRGNGYLIENTECSFNGRSGIQVNGIPTKKPIYSGSRRNALAIGVDIRNCVLNGNQKDYDAGGLHLFGVHVVNVTECRIERHEGRDCITLWDDGRSEKDASCKSVVLRDNRLSFNFSRPRAGIWIGKGTEGFVSGGNSLSSVTAVPLEMWES